MYLSSPLVGCTGNASIGQALSYGKIPYYEQLGQTKQTKKNLCDIAYNLCGNDSPLVYLLDAEPRVMMIDSEEREKLRNARLVEDAKKLGDLIKDQYSINESLCGMVNSHLFKTKFPEAVVAIDEIKHRFLSREINIEAAKAETMSVLQKNDLLENARDVGLFPVIVDYKDRVAIIWKFMMNRPGTMLLKRLNDSAHWNSFIDE
jgi:hypothetical protein